MADENVNIPNNGDILGSNDSSEKVVNRIEQSVASIDSGVQRSNELLLELTRSNRTSGSGNFTSRVDEAINTRRPSSSSFKSSMKSSSGNAVDDILSGFEEALSEALGISDLNENFDKYISNITENLAKQLDVSPDELSKTISKQLSKDAIDKFTSSNSKIAKALTSAANWYVDGFKKAFQDSSDAFDSYIESNFDTKSASKFKISSLISNNSDTGESSATSRVPSGTSVSRASSSGQLDTVYVKNLVVDSSAFNSVDSSSLDAVTEGISSVASFYSEGTSVGSAAKDAIGDVAGDAAVTAGKAAMEAAKAKDIGVLVKGLGSAVTAFKSAGPQIIASIIVDGITSELGEFVTHVSSAIDKMASTADRLDKSRWAKVDAQEARMQQDIETYIKQPFEILEDAAQKVYDVWDQTLQTITATQGYDKAGLQDLMSAYASRLRSEGLSDVVGTTDVTSMLESILNAGLSGKVAEEFAYQATVLNKAIPTEDFTSYASSYASLASSYMSLGHSQQEALQYANEQLQTFASNILTASREVSGGFTTSLTGVSDLFNEIVRISQTAGTSDTSNISSALSIVQAIAGQVSPETGNALVSQIVSAATGGNDSSLVALRSLAGTGASNTAFLQAFAANPNQVLANMFEGLQNMFDKSTDNYMEVAYSLADTFGITADAMTRIDWGKLVDELRSNSSSTSALTQNMQLLASGETTTSAESQRLAQINQYMIDEGLSYVLDNEAARMIQQHMWDQELAADMQEATYAVDFAGGALELMTSIQSFLGGVLNVLTLGLANLGQVANSAQDYSNITNDIKNMLEAGKVGEGNKRQLHDLTTYNVDAITRTPSYMEFWGLPSAYRDQFGYGPLGTIANAGNVLSDVAGDVLGQAASNLSGVGLTSSLAYNLFNALYNLTNSSSSASGPSSMYSWGGAGKSVLTSISEPVQSPNLSGVTSSSVTEQISQQTTAALSKWFDSMGEFVSNGLTFQDWMNSASDYGFTDAASAMEQAGYTKSDLEQAYIQEGTNQAVTQEIENRQKEVEFWDAGINWWNTVYPTDRDAWNQKYDANFLTWTTMFTDQMTNWSTLYTDTMTAFREDLNVKYLDWRSLYEETVAETHKKLQYANNQFDNEFVNGFLYDWRDYYIGNHTHYREATNYEASLRTINTEKNQTGEAVLALAQTLTKNYSDLADPAVQTNVLLGQIVILLQSIFTAQQAGKGLTLPTALASLGLNITNPKSSS